MSGFTDGFWGEKHTGFETLSANLKVGEQSCKDLEDFFKQCQQVEDASVKSYSKLLKNFTGYNTNGSVGPIWEALKEHLEKISASHSDLAKKWHETSKEIHKYSETLVKKCKTIRESQTGTADTVQAMQSVTTQLAKSKELYNTRFNDYKKLLTDRAAAKKIERGDLEFKKATEDYKNVVKKYNTTLEEFLKRMTAAVEIFQGAESEFLTQMDTFLRSYSAIREEHHTEVGELHYNYHSAYSQLTIEKLLQTYVQHKSTGTALPVPVEFEEADLTSLPPPPSPEDAGSLDGNAGRTGDATTPTTTTSMMHLDIKAIFKRRKRNKKEKDGDNRDADSLGQHSNTSQTEVDEEGYTIRKERSIKEDDSWESDSSDSGSDTDLKTNKIKVNIKPLENGTAANGFNSNTISPRIGPAGGGSHTDDLLDLFGPSPPATVNNINRVNILPMPFATYLHRSTPNVSTNQNAAGGLETTFSAEDKEVGNSWRSQSSSQIQIAPSLPRPPSRKDISSGRLSAHRFSPSTSMMTRNESFGNNMQVFSNNNNIGTDSIPVAIALSERVQSNFKGQHHDSKIVGDVMISFAPDTISKTTLPEFSFKIVGRSSEQVLVNKELIETNGDVHRFIPDKLLSALKEKAKQPGSRFLNLPIVRYTLTITCLPLTLTAFWKCEPPFTDFRLDYEYVGSALSKPLPLSDVKFKVPINGGLQAGSEQTDPVAVWSAELNAMQWNIPEIKSGDTSKGSLKGRFPLESGPGSPAPVSVAYKADGTILSGTDFVLNNSNYKITLTKRSMTALSNVEMDKLVTYV